LEPYSADLKIAVGDDASRREDLMEEICVGVADADGAQGLLQRLAAIFDRSSVSFDATRNQVRVRSDRESRTVVRVIDAVQSWLAADGVDSAELSLGNRSYTMVGPSAGAARSFLESDASESKSRPQAARTEGATAPVLR
jgi:hypothetical protein